MNACIFVNYLIKKYWTENVEIFYYKTGALMASCHRVNLTVNSDNNSSNFIPYTYTSLIDQISKRLKSVRYTESFHKYCSTYHVLYIFDNILARIISSVSGKFPAIIHDITIPIFTQFNSTISIRETIVHKAYTPSTYIHTYYIIVDRVFICRRVFTEILTQIPFSSNRIL